MLPKNVEDAYALSPMQHLMLLHAVSSAGNGVLLNQVCYRIRGPLDAAAFHRAWDSLVARHPALRTAFLWEGLPQPLQVVRGTVTLPFRHIDLTNHPTESHRTTIDQLRHEDLRNSMVLGKAPLMRCTLVKLAAHDHYFIWAVHHLIVDRWSHGLLFADLRALYSANLRDEPVGLGPAAPYRGYIEWVARQDRAADERFWRGELAGVREPTLLGGGDGMSRHARRLTTRHSVNREISSAVLARASQWRTTPAAMLLSAVSLATATLAKRDDVVLGITVASRPPELGNAEVTVGSFVNNIPARVTLERSRTVADWIRDVQRAQGRRQAFSHVSLRDIHAWSEVSPARPLFDTLVLLNLTDESEMPWPGVELTADTATLDAAYPLLLSITIEKGQLVFALVHDATFDRANAVLSNLGVAIGRILGARASTLVADLLPGVPSRNGASAAVAVSNGHSDPIANGSAADALLHAWQDVLGIEQLGLDDDFFALGGTSLQAAQLFSRVERITGKVLPLSTLVAAGSVRSLLAAIDSPLPRTSTLVGLRSSGTRPPLYAIPGIGGNVVGLSALARALGAEQPFFAFESPGLDGQAQPLATIDAIADRFASDIAREDVTSFHLVGLCWGAAVAAEMARKLIALGRVPTSVSLIDPTSLLREVGTRSRLDTAGFLRSRLELYWDEFREGDWTDRTRMLATKARRAAQVLVGGEERRQSQGELNQFRVMEANKSAVLQYVPTPLRASARIFVTPYRGEGDDPRLEWLSLLEPQPDVIPVRGANAGDAISPANADELAGCLRAWLRESERTVNR